MNQPSGHGSFTRGERFTANEADLAWLTRYQQRVRNHDVHTPHQILQELTAFEMPVPGIDGGQYTTYIHDHPFDDLYTVVVDYPGWADHVDFPRADVPDNARGDGLLAAWVQDRTDRAPRPLQSAPAYQMARSEQEETVLAHLLAHPEDLTELDWLPADTFTADLRHLYLTTMRDLHQDGRAVTAATVAAGVQDALVRLSPWYRKEIEETSAPQDYLHRIALTTVEPAAAFANAEHLLTADTRIALATEATTYTDPSGYWHHSRPMQQVVDTGPVIRAVTMPDRQQVWAPPPPTDPWGQPIHPPF